MRFCALPMRAACVAGRGVCEPTHDFAACCYNGMRAHFDVERRMCDCVYSESLLVHAAVAITAISSPQHQRRRRLAVQYLP